MKKYLILKKYLDFQKEIQAFEDTAAPPGHSLLWEDTDKTYGYVNNYTGEVTFKYPTAVAKPKKAEKAKTKSKVETDSSGNPWKYSLDGSITGGVKIKNLRNTIILSLTLLESHS